ncbi:DUF2163 domain-containing protein [Methylocapsa acidiphila]|uniref:DUF2163 domain-containing protein n=1 Tax=Methylocapsa acidiphila TaxID=133552 RepID=UPI00047DCAF7|nr:DUF2163 domain-containing protein [Methylocapsa acidiphila]
MRSASPDLVEFLGVLRSNCDITALVGDCFTLTLQNGLILTVTNADVSIALNGAIYQANSILIDGLRLKSSVGLEVDQQQITISARTVDTLGGIPFMQAVRNGIFDGALIQRERAFLKTWTEPPIGSVVLFKGRVGAVDNVGRTTAQLTVNSDLVLLDIEMPRNIYSPSCQHKLYDSGCTLIKSAFGAMGQVGAGSTPTIINWSAAAAEYAQGTIAFTSGPNIGATANIKAAVAGSLTLSNKLPHQPTVGDAFTVYQGCDHTLSTCRTKFNNQINFRGFPFIPPPTYDL